MAILDNLVAYWKLDETSGNRADSAGANTLTDNNTVGYAAGRAGNAADFEAANSEYLSIADNAALSAGNVDFTLAAWVNPESIVDQHVIAGKWGASAPNLEYILDIYQGAGSLARWIVVPVGGGTATTLTASTHGALSTGTWYLIIAWHDATANTLNIQINNGTVDSTAHSTGIEDYTVPFQLGAKYGGSAFFDGLIDEVAIWKRVLTSAERTLLYNGGNGLSYPLYPRNWGVIIG